MYHNVINNWYLKVWYCKFIWNHDKLMGCFIDINKLSSCIGHFQGQKAIAQHSFFLLMILYVTFDDVPLSIWCQKLNIKLELHETIIKNNPWHLGLWWEGRFCFWFIVVDNNYIILEKINPTFQMDSHFGNWEFCNVSKFWSKVWKIKFCLNWIFFKPFERCWKINI